MDTILLESYLKNIRVQNLENADVDVVNHSPLKIMGKGRQGAVFQFTEDICVKVFGNEEDCEREYHALSLGQHTDLFPKLYGRGRLYIAMEIIRGVDLREYLQSQPLTAELSAKLVEMLVVFRAIGYERIDHHKRQIYLQPDGNLKVIDVARTIWRDRVYPYPRKLLTSLGEEYKELFLMHVKAMAPSLYEEWEHYIRMEKLSRELFSIIVHQPYDEAAIRNASQNLLTTKDKEQYAVGLENLVYKVFKDEWVKAMLLMGYNPDQVKDQIDEYWDRREEAHNQKEAEEIDQTFKEEMFNRLVLSKRKGEQDSKKSKTGQNKKGKHEKDKKSSEKQRKDEKQSVTKDDLLKMMLSLKTDRDRDGRKSPKKQSSSRKGSRREGNRNKKRK